jgi:hypothetical protein
MENEIVMFEIIFDPAENYNQLKAVTLMKNVTFPAFYLDLETKEFSICRGSVETFTVLKKVKLFKLALSPAILTEKNRIKNLLPIIFMPIDIHKYNICFNNSLQAVLIKIVGIINENNPYSIQYQWRNVIKAVGDEK